MSDIACKVSIFCTAYNHEPYIREALDSFVNQETDFAFEVLVNDDCSADGTAAVIREYAQRYPHIIRPFLQTENQFSKGLAHLYATVFYANAKGRYFAFCEGDDKWCDPHKLQKQVDFLETNPDYSACVHNTLLHYCGGEQPDAPLLPKDGGDRDVGLDTVIRGMSRAFHTSSILARREFVLDPPDYYEQASAHGFLDYAIALRLCLSGKVRFLDQIMSVYRISSNATAWSAKLEKQYARLTEFIRGEIAMMEALRAHVDTQQLPCVERELLARRYELADIEGRVEELVQPPFDQIFRSRSAADRLKTRIKILFPALHRLYRKRQGYR